MKRIFDFVLSFVLILIALPLAVIVCIILIFTKQYPPILAQERVGKNGKVFKLYKFKTMNKDAEKNGPQITKSFEDPRITRFGLILRKTYLDELPQLFNVIKGEMSFVGPRPERPYFHKRFSREIKGWDKRLIVPQGMTGLSQIKNALHPHNPRCKIKYDLEYVGNHDVFLDLKIILKTVFKRR